MNNTKKLMPLHKLSKKATKVFEVLIADMDKDECRRINNSSVCMEVVVEFMRDVSIGSLYRIGHYYKQNGDLMRDPEVEFLLFKDQCIPLCYQLDGLGICQEYAYFKSRDNIAILDTVNQHKCVEFCNQWMENIKYQQSLKIQ